MAKKFFSPEISVIIPMYNVENFIGECLQSLLNQTFQNFELIVVDDCSTDNSVKVVEDFSQKFENRLTLLKLDKNSGVPGLPRNFGLNFACGKYIYFLDSDDFIEPDTFEKFFEIAEKFSADVVHSEKCLVQTEMNGEIKIEIASTQTGEFVNEPTLETFDIGERVQKFIDKKFLWWGCNKLFRRKFLIDNKINFPNMTSYEDLIFCFQCVVCAKNYVRVPFVNYHYRIRGESLSHKGIDAIESAKNLREAVRTLDDFMLGEDFFVENSQLRYAVIDFFAQEILDKIAKNLFIANDFDTGEVYDFFERNIFSDKIGKNSALTSYFFITTSLYKLLSQQQANQIAELQKNLAKFQS